MKTSPSDFTRDKLEAKLSDVSRQVGFIQDVIQFMEKDAIRTIRVMSGTAIDDAVQRMERFAKAAQTGFTEAKQARDNALDPHGPESISAAPKSRKKSG